MPHLVQMHEKWAKDGLVAVTVNINFAEQEKPKEKYLNEAVALLKGKNVHVVNLFLDEPEPGLTAILEGKLHLQAFPAIYVFDRQGRWTAFKAVKDAVPGDEKAIEKFVEKLVLEIAK